jgi:hypothetical protein
MKTLSVDDFEETAKQMAQRSKFNFTITYMRLGTNSKPILLIFIGTLRATISFKSGSTPSKRGAIADFQGLRIRIPAHVYQRRTWTAPNFFSKLRKDLSKAALKQFGPSLAGFLRLETKRIIAT